MALSRTSREGRCRRRWSRIALEMPIRPCQSKTPLGRATAADCDLTEVASIACVHSAILEFDKGCDTLVGAPGVTLSGGQRRTGTLEHCIVLGRDVTAR